MIALLTLRQTVTIKADAYQGKPCVIIALLIPAHLLQQNRSLQTFPQIELVFNLLHCRWNFFAVELSYGSKSPRQQQTIIL
ncbi:hypothetical protein NUACC21_68720 [Scytonema sp. NUACC21]